MKILITGATGFIGQHLLDHLATSEHSLRIISRQEKPKFWCENKKFELVKADLADLNGLGKALEGIEVVINLAAELKDKDKFSSTNILGVKNLIHLSKKFGIKRIIHLSSVGVVGAQYSASQPIIDEEAKCKPKNEYERTKLESEDLLKKAFADGKHKLFILRPTNVFGEHHPRKALLNFLSKIKNGSTVLFAKNAMVNYIYVKDLADCISYFIKASEDDQVFNVGHSIKMEEFCSSCYALLGKKNTFKKIPSVFLRIPSLLGYFGSASLKARVRALSNTISYADHRLLKKWNYPYGIKEGISRTIMYYKKEENL